MTAAVVDPAAVAHLAAVVSRIRHSWHPPGIRTALENALIRHDYGTVALVAVASARDPLARTPAVIGARCDNGWSTMVGDPETATSTPTPPRADQMRCPRCDAWLIDDETVTHNCHDRATPDQARNWADQAKAAAAAAPRPTAKETTA